MQKADFFISLEGHVQCVWLLVFLINLCFVFILYKKKIIFIFTIENKNYLLWYTEIVTVTFWCIFFQICFVCLYYYIIESGIWSRCTFTSYLCSLYWERFLITLSILKTLLCTDCVMLYFGMYSCSWMFMLPPRMNDAALNRLAFRLWPSS